MHTMENVPAMVLGVENMTVVQDSLRDSLKRVKSFKPGRRSIKVTKEGRVMGGLQGRGDAGGMQGGVASRGVGLGGTPTVYTAEKVGAVEESFAAVGPRTLARRSQVAPVGSAVARQQSLEQGAKDGSMPPTNSFKQADSRAHNSTEASNDSLVAEMLAEEMLDEETLDEETLAEEIITEEMIAEEMLDVEMLEDVGEGSNSAHGGRRSGSSSRARRPSDGTEITASA
jgi:hypothetical protein